MSFICSLRQVYLQAAGRTSVGHKRCLTYLGNCKPNSVSRRESSSATLLNQRSSARHVCGSPVIAARAGFAPPQQRSVAARDDTLDWDEEVDEPESGPAEPVVLPAPAHTRVKTADFVKSSTAVKDCPPAKHPEFAVIGRSNVGKSSLINMLTGKKALAQISKTPGTQEL